MDADTQAFLERRKAGSLNGPPREFQVLFGGKVVRFKEVDRANGVDLVFNCPTCWWEILVPAGKWVGGCRCENGAHITLTEEIACPAIGGCATRVRVRHGVMERG